MARPGSFASWLSDLIGGKAPSSDASSPPVGDVEPGSLSQIELQLMERGQARPDGEIRPEYRLQPIVDDGRANGQYLDEPFRLAQAEVGKKITTKHMAIDPARKVFVLPEGTSIDDITVDGKNLVLRQPDGTEITLDNAVTTEGTSLKVVGIIVGGVEIPAATLAAALGISDVQIAAGESGARGSGANLAAAEGDIGDPFAITPLLPPTELVFDRPKFDEILPPGVEKDNGVQILDLVPAAEGGDATVSEAGLPDGTQPATDLEKTNGSFTINAPDGVAAVTIGGVVVISNGALTGNAITTALGVLQVTGFNAVTGEVSYTYTLVNPADHDAVQGPNGGQFDNFQVVVTDTDGDAASATLSVQIIDDVPSLSVSDAPAALVMDELLADGGSVQDEGGAAQDDEAGVTLPAALSLLGTAIGAATADGSTLFNAAEFGPPTGASGIGCPGTMR